MRRVLLLVFILCSAFVVSGQDLNDSIYVNRMVQIVDSLKIERLNVSIYKDLCERDYKEILRLNDKVSVCEDKIRKQRNLVCLFGTTSGIFAVMVLICLLV